MRTKFSKKQIEILEKIDGIILEMKLCALDCDREIILDLCLHGEMILDFYYEDESENISEELIEMISEITYNLDELFQSYDEKENFIKDLIYNCLDKYMNNYILGYLKTTYKENKTGRYANLIINVLKEAQFIDKKINHVYVNHNILEMIMLFGQNCFYDEFGVNTIDLHKKFILACNDFHNQFKKDYPLMLEYSNEGLNYFAKTNCGVRRFIRNTINNIVKYLEIEIKKLPIFITLSKNKRNGNNKVNLNIYIGKKCGKFVYGDTFIVDKKIKKLDLKKITSEIEEVINSSDSMFDIDLDFVLNIVEGKLGIAA